MALDIPQVFSIHLFACYQQRPAGHPRGSCMTSGARPLWDYLGARLEKLGDPRVALTATGCLGFCRAGPLMVVYPQGIWYTPRSEADIDAIIDGHIVAGAPVERLIVVPQP